ncbi:Cd(II)/Pb(II)-responsive transcriptional regulator [Marinobacter zhejiangensis]|uniref:Cd(II)/Pb(II)-responsive transcriptional regulator n=1 Tax=Marinobacter zhejiangensis TaxID=488535 RepID=A0A1I4T1C3_9GAMM|nr:Cd(II)/Pb(II)-responsive transcriptional regulator [Marinobacter zhejiangensis]SFM70542.1 Cd(II)/Pb(II)-responsive transcriptional regulator [Marinobacter zhejiangensis]
MKIGQVSKQTGIPVETIRYYEKVGLLPEPAREDSGYRRYGNEHVQRLAFIRRCRTLDMTQEEIRELLHLAQQPGRNCQDVDDLLARHLNHVRARLRELQDLEQELEQLRDACSNDGTMAQCGILGGLTEAVKPAEKNGHGNHIPGSHGH